MTMMLLETWLIPITALLIEGGSLTGGSLSRSASVLRIARILRVFRTARIIRVARGLAKQREEGAGRSREPDRSGSVTGRRWKNGGFCLGPGSQRL